MEIVIVICLIIVIILLLKDKVVIRKATKSKSQQPPLKSDLPEIMGKPRPLVRHSLPNVAAKSQSEKPEVIPDTFESETEEKDFAREIPQEELDDVFGDGPDLAEEENEWKEQGSPNSEDGFATGVTYEELMTVGTLLKKEAIEPALTQKAVDIVQRIQGTELFSLLESSIEEASRKIAALLDKSLPLGMDSGASNLRNGGLEGFDIGEFV